MRHLPGLDIPELVDFLDDNAALLVNHDADFSSLCKHYTDNKIFLYNWIKLINYPEISPTVTKYEYIFTLIPVALGAFLSFFGMLLGLTNFKNFANIFGNSTLLIISATITLLITLLGVSFITRDLRQKSYETSFQNWFYLGIINRLFFEKKIHDSVVEDELIDLYHVIAAQLKKTYTVRLSVLKKRFLIIVNHLNINKKNTQKINLNFSIKQKNTISEEFIAANSELNEPKKLKPRSFIYRIWLGFKYNVLDNQALWDSTIGNIGMSMGLIGVLIGSIKSIFDKFGMTVAKSIIESPIASYISLGFAVAIISLNMYSQKRGRRYQKERAALFDRQSEFLTDLIKLIQMLPKQI